MFEAGSGCVAFVFDARKAENISDVEILATLSTAKLCWYYSWVIKSPINVFY